MFPPASMVPPITESTFPVPRDPPMPTRGENIYFILLLHPSQFAPQKRLRKKNLSEFLLGEMSAAALIRREQQRRLIAPLIVLVGTNQPTNQPLTAINGKSRPDQMWYRYKTIFCEVFWVASHQQSSRSLYSFFFFRDLILEPLKAPKSAS